MTFTTDQLRNTTEAQLLDALERTLGKCKNTQAIQEGLALVLKEAYADTGKNIEQTKEARPCCR